MSVTLTLTALAAAITFGAAAVSANAQNYPNRPIRMVVGFPAGGGTDITARLVGDKLSKAWGQPVIIDNRAGAGGIIATEFVARAASDGYTLIMGGGNAMTVNPAVYKKLPYDPLKDFVPITMVIQSPLVMAIHPSIPAKSVQEMLAYLKANPDKANFSSANMHTRLAGEMLHQMSGIKITPVAYKGGGPAVNGVLTGDVPMTLMDAGSVMPQIRGGLLRGLAVTTSARARAVPELPTVAESGVPGYDIGTWFGLFAPAGTPQDIVSKLNAEVARIVALPDVKEAFAKLGGDGVGNSAEDFANQIRNDIVRFTKAARAANMEPEE